MPEDFDFGIKDYAIMPEAQFRMELMTELKKMNDKINPMYDVFNSVSGFNKIAVVIMKTFAGIGLFLGGLYAVIEFFKKLGKG